LNDKNSFEMKHESVLDTMLHNKVSTNVSGAGIVSSQNIIDGHFVRNMTDGKNVIVG
jgi:hypothetical protein